MAVRCRQNEMLGDVRSTVAFAVACFLLIGIRLFFVLVETNPDLFLHPQCIEVLYCIHDDRISCAMLHDTGKQICGVHNVGRGWA